MVKVTSASYVVVISVLLSEGDRGLGLYEFQRLMI